MPRAALSIVFALTVAACAPPPAALLPGDSGPCTTVVLANLPDGGESLSLAPCHFEKGK